MTPSIRREYLRLRSLSWPALDALRSARIRERFAVYSVRELVFLEVAQRRVVRGWYRISRRDGWVLADEVLVCAGDDLESRLADIREAALAGLMVAFRREAGRLDMAAVV